jgi:hypothetical protein
MKEQYRRRRVLVPCLRPGQQVSSDHQALRLPALRPSRLPMRCLRNRGPSLTAWRMAHELRKLMVLADDKGLLSGHIEIDETLIGAEPR